MRKSLNLILLVSLGFSACSGRYELQKDNEGRTIRVDKWFGDVAVIHQNKLIELSTPNEDHEDSQVKTWPAVDMLGAYKGESVTLSTKWTNQNIAYNFELTPQLSTFSSLAKNPYHQFTILLYDSSGFLVRRVTVPLFSMSKQLNKEGSPFGYDFSGLLPMSFAEYDKIKNWNVEWNF